MIFIEMQIQLYEQTKEVKVMMEISKTDVKVTFNDDEHSVLSGPVKESKCNWKIPFKNGESVIKTNLSDVSGDLKHATITIDGKDGTITIVVEAEERPNQKIRLVDVQVKDKK